jgi:hypothetical protein
VAGTYDREVPPVDRRDFGDTETLGRGDDRRVDRAKRQVAIARDQLGDTDPVRCRHRLDLEGAGREIAEEADLGLGAEARRQQVDDLGDDQRWDDQRAGMGLQQLERRLMMSVVGVDVRVERTGVDDDRGYGATSAARISSIRSETSLCPLRPVPAAPR